MRHELEDPEGDVKLTLGEGDDVAIVLKELGPAGYVWEVVAPSAAVTIVKEAVATEKADPRVVGGPSRVRFVLAQPGPGTTVTKLVHRRPWAPDDDAGHLTVTLVRTS